MDNSHFQQQENNGSPRRRKPPLDLDTALFLQSQASRVQELNNSNSNSINSLNKTPGSQQRHGPPKQDCWSFRNTSGYYPNSTTNNNISVDYIDCLSNDDLPVAAHLSQHHTSSMNNSSSAMKGLGCRKHLRFHRNRVDPSLDKNKNNSNDDNIQSLSSTEETSIKSFGNEDSTSAANPPATSCLYPISVSEVKEKTYFLGQLNQDSLLGHDELIRYFPNSRVNIFVCTWNQNRRRAPMNLQDLLLPSRLNYMPDIYAVGIQEAFSSQGDYLKEWEIELQTTLGPSHVLLHSCSLGVLHLSLFIRRDLIWFCSVPEESCYNSRSMPTNMLNTKGSISIAFRFFGTSFMFTNCHFPAHENKLKDRIEEYQRIIQSIDLPKNLKLLKPRYLSNDSTARFDCVFFMGDLNFRLEQRTFDETVQILDDIFSNQQQQASEKTSDNHINNNISAASSSNSVNKFDILTQNDELLKVMESQQAFYGFDECLIKFPPTYKFLAKTNLYDRQTKRVPSYTDRILFRSKRQKHIQCLTYDWLPQLLSSDHKPVYCLFDVLIRPGSNNLDSISNKLISSTLNAGLFQRTIYLEALKRRAELNSDSMRENGTGGSLICSIT